MRNPTSSVQVSGSLDRAESVSMSIDPSGMAHVMSVLTNLYSNAPLAVLREYATNAADAHVAAGVDRPVEVTLPSHLDPTLVVRDHGVGLSERQIVEVYARYGASSKRADDTQVGAFGLGCKSAFTITSQFVVSAVQDGRRCTVLLALDEAGVGEVTVLHRESTQDGNGVRVSIPVSDVEVMQREAARFFATWQAGAVLVDGQPPVSVFDGALLLPHEIAVVSGRHPVASPGWHVVVGGVSYPVSQSLLGQVLDEHPDLRSVIRLSTYARVDIGAVDITPSREGLRDTPRTVALVRALLRSVAVELVDTVQQDLDDQPDLPAAVWRRRHLRQQFTDVVLPWAKMRWRGLPFQQAQPVPLPGYRIQRPHRGRETVSFGAVNALDADQLNTVQVVTGTPAGAAIDRAARRYLRGTAGVDLLLFSERDQDCSGWFAFGPGRPTETLDYATFRQHSAALLTPTFQPRRATQYAVVSQGDVYRFDRVTAAELAEQDLPPVVLTPDDRPLVLGLTPLGRRVCAERTVVMLDPVQSLAVLARAVPDLIQGGPFIRSLAQQVSGAASADQLAVVERMRAAAWWTPIRRGLQSLLGERISEVTGGPIGAALADADALDADLARLTPAQQAALHELRHAQDVMGGDPRNPHAESTSWVKEHAPLLGLSLFHQSWPVEQTHGTHLLAYLNGLAGPHAAAA